MQTFNQNVINSVKIRDLKNVHYELYQNSNVLQDENDIKICDDKKKEKDEDDNKNGNKKLKYIVEKKIDFRIWEVKNENEKKEKKKKNDEKNNDDEIE